MRVRLRPAYPDPAEFYAQRYPDGYQHTVWPDHVERVEATVQFAWSALQTAAPVSVIADLSAGDGAIPRTLQERLDPRPTLYLSDYRHRDGYDDQGAVEDTLADMPYADLYVCSETVEHLDNPDTFLKGVRAKASRLVLTTPVGEFDPDQNPEHYWGWEQGDIQDMLVQSGWRPYLYAGFTPSSGPYTFQMWAAS